MGSFVAFFALGCIDSTPTLNPTPALNPTPILNPTPTPRPLTQAEINIQISKEIVEEYHRTHTYYGKDIFVCGDMASDVWNMLKTKGINAEIWIGNVEKDISSSFEANHAWVLAETSPNRWIALETTGGYIVYREDNPLYYKGWKFYTPKQFKDYLALLKQYNDQVDKYNEAIREYNRLVDQYNQASIFEKISLKSRVETQYAVVNQRAKDLEETATKIKLLLSY